MDSFIDYYQLLGLTPLSTPDQIKQAFRQLARHYHPDVAGKSATEQFQLIHEAYQVLIDPQKRSHYDKRWQVYHKTNIKRSEPPTVRHHRSSLDPRIVINSTQQPLSPEDQVDVDNRIKTIRAALKAKAWYQAISQAEDLIETYPPTRETVHLLALAYQRLGSTHLIEGNYDEARSYLNLALETEPDNRELGFDIKRDLDRLQAYLQS